MNSIVKNREFYDKKWSGVSALARRCFVYECKQKVDSVKKLLTIAYKDKAMKGKNVLDIGFGDGNIFLLFKKNHIFGIETSEIAIVKFLKSTKRDFLSWEIKKASDNNVLPFLDATMDIVVLSHVLEHVEQPEFLLQESWRVLKENGCLFLLLPINEKFYKHPGHFSIWDEKKACDVLDRAGFRINYYEENGNFEHFTDLVMNTRDKFMIGILTSFVVNIFLSFLPFRMRFFEPAVEIFGLKPRQLILIASPSIHN